MPPPSDLAPFLAPLESLEIPYCVTGSVAAGIYGEPRTTMDVDFVVLLRVEHIAKLRAAFPEESYYVPPLDTLLMETARGARGMFNLIHRADMLKADIYLAARDPLHWWALEHRRRTATGDGFGFWVAPPEYVIVRKLEYFREGGQEKHLRDIRFMLAVTPVDRPWIEEQVARLGLQPQWAASQP